MVFDERLAVLGLLRQAQFGLERDGVREAALLALRHGVLRLLDVVLDELEEEVLPRVGDREVHLEDRLETLVLPRAPAERRPAGSCSQDSSWMFSRSGDSTISGIFPNVIRLLVWFFKSPTPSVRCGSAVPVVVPGTNEQADRRRPARWRTGSDRACVETSRWSDGRSRPRAGRCRSATSARPLRRLPRAPSSASRPRPSGCLP